MASESIPKKRKAPTPDSENDCEDKKEESKDSHAQLKDHIPFKRDELNCRVCMDLPTNGKLFQCDNGHLLCLDCLTRVLEGDSAVCPVCRVSLSRSRPTRNRFAEMVLAQLTVTCTNEGCNATVEFGKLNAHVKEKCAYRPVECRFHPIGCDWNGIANQKDEHEETCPMKEKSAKKILKRVIERNKQFEEKYKNLETTMAKYVELSHTLEKRCRNIVIKDILIERDEICQENSSKTFTAFGYAFQILLEKNDSEPKQSGLVIRLCDSVKHKMTLTVFILRGPQLQVPLVPSLHKVVFKRKTRKSEFLPLPLTPREGDSLWDLQALHLRVGFVDMSRGRVSHDFTSQHVAESDESSDTDSDHGHPIYYSDDGSSSDDNHSLDMYHHHDHDDEDDESDDEDDVSLLDF